MPLDISLIFNATPKRFMCMLSGEDSPGEFGKVIARNSLEMMVFNPIPQIVKPIAEAYVNDDLFHILIKSENLQCCWRP